MRLVCLDMWPMTVIREKWHYSAACEKMGYIHLNSVATSIPEVDRTQEGREIGVWMQRAGVKSRPKGVLVLWGWGKELVPVVCRVAPLCRQGECRPARWGLLDVRKAWPPQHPPTSSAQSCQTSLEHNYSGPLLKRVAYVKCTKQHVILQGVFVKIKFGCCDRDPKLPKSYSDYGTQRKW